MPLGHSVRLRLTPRGIKTIEHNGGIDAYLLDTNDSKALAPEMKVLKRRVVSAKGKKDAKKAAARAVPSSLPRGGASWPAAASLHI